MPRKSQDHVHRLVRSMTPAEKRYYKLHLARQATEHNSNQEVLFDAIAAMEAYDEAYLLARFAHEAFTHRFAITKRRLYESILRSLGSFHAESSIDARLYRLLHQVELLQQRAMYDDAAKVLVGVRKSAEHHERTTVLMAVVEWERRLIECRNYSGVDEEALDRLARASRLLADQGTQLEELWTMKSKVFLHLYRQGQARDPGSWDRLKAMLDHPMLREGESLSTARARFLYHHVHGAAAFALGDTDACRDHLIQNLALLNTDRACFADEPSLVLGVLSNLVYTCIQAGRYSEAFEHLKRFRTLPSEWDMPESEDLDVKLFSTTTSLELSVHLRLGDTKSALGMAPVVQRGLAKHAHLISPMRRAGFHYQLAYAHFAAGQHERALSWLNELLNGVRVDDSSDAVCFGRLLQLLTLLELGKTDVLKFTLRNTERFLRLHARKHRFEPMVLNLVHDLMKERSEVDRRALLESFHREMLKLHGDPFERTVFDHFDPIAWVESKLLGEPFAQRIKLRASKFAQAA